ncbi:sensor histidine kinase [Mucilaginibacter segetis]|uniref:histidine kinase n=1 Tax=Mucilaginibacter segetis TaxID=2793071 RepID=A0A934PWL3_9SPHI|nr:HAMP domain-containing sensor histidine kinase [Mucilaginibacter segetis]MBK0380480.1 hypothetical protein [Mucilaginibacter segetis]
MDHLHTLKDSIALCGPECGPSKTALAQHASFSEQFTDFFTKIFNTNDWPPRWHCGTWTDFHGWLYILSDVGIWASYFAIPILILRLLRKRKDIPFHKIFLLFVAFIMLCGLTHLMDAIIFWWPAYRIGALLRFATAVVSATTVYALYKILPSVFNLRSVSELEAEIEKRRIVEEKLAKSEFLLSEAGRISRVGGWETELPENKRTWSKTVFDIFELPYNHNIDDYDTVNHFPEQYGKLLAISLDEAKNEGKKWDHELLLQTAKNNMIWVRSTGEPQYDEQGKIVKLRGIMMDINRYKLNELALNKSLELTTQNNHQLKNFTHILSHNIRNHASNMALISSLVDLNNMDKSNAELFEKMSKVSAALNSTLEDLSEAIKIKENIISSDVVNFKVITDKALEIFESDLKQMNAGFTTDFKVQEVNFPRIYLESILVNLISNSIKYSRPDVQLVITLRTYKNKDRKTVFECEDNGLGIDLKLHGNKIFGLYKTFHDRIDAHGVGLFLVKTQVESQKGQIKVESMPGKGSKFKIIFNE